MREKLETLSLAALRDITKNKQIKNISAMRKKELIDAILETVSDEENNKTAEQTPAPQENTKENTPAQAQGQTKQTSGGTNMASIGDLTDRIMTRQWLTVRQRRTEYLR